MIKEDIIEMKLRGCSCDNCVGSLVIHNKCFIELYRRLCGGPGEGEPKEKLIPEERICKLWVQTKS
jgi:hypothetical protein